MEKKETVIRKPTEWLCISCGSTLGNIHGGEFYPAVEGRFMRTNGPNLTVTCPQCGTIKTFYTSDPVVRAIYQLVDALATVAARAMVQQMSAFIHENTNVNDK